jgi:hypothetical protein
VIDDVTCAIPLFNYGSYGCFVLDGLVFCECVLDRVEGGRVGQQVKQLAAVFALLGRDVGQTAMFTGRSVGGWHMVWIGVSKELC